MKIGCFCMVRNEGMIIPAFLDQISEFFDVSIFLDHSSSDDTPNLIRNYILANQKNNVVKLFHLIGEGQPQMEVSNFFARKLFKEYDLDYVFLLDCDEFLPFDNKQGLTNFLKDFKNEEDVIYYKWRNLCPEFLNGNNDIFKNNFFISKRNEKQSTKVILTRNILKDDEWQLVQGNHYVVHAQGKKFSCGINNSVELYHIPILSYNKFMFKIMAGSLRLRMEKKLLSKGLGAHWDTLNSKISRLGIDHDEIVSYAMGYPDKGDIDDSTFLSFSFPYVKSPVLENKEILVSMLQGMMNQVSHIGLDPDNITLLEENESDYVNLPDDFDRKKYFILNPDVINSLFNPEYHYMKYGFYENRKYK